MELAILMNFMEKSWEKMSQEERKEFISTMGLSEFIDGIPSSLPVLALQTIIKASGFKFYQLAVIVANAIAKFILGRGLSLAGNVILTRTISIFVGSIGWILTGIWTAIDIAGPAYRVTIPCVVHIAMLRQQSRLLYCSFCQKTYSSDAKVCPNCGKEFA